MIAKTACDWLAFPREMDFCDVAPVEGRAVRVDSVK